MISLELSMVQRNSKESALLALQMEEFLSRGGRIQEFGTTNYATPPFNAEITPSAKVSKAVQIQKSEKAVEFERGIAEKLRAFIGLGVAAAAKELGLGTRRLNFIAAAYGIVFETRSHDSAIRRKRAEEVEMVPKVRQMIADGMNQTAISNALGVNRVRLRRMAKDHDITLPSFVDEAADRALIERITAFRDLGLPRRVCAKRMGIATKKLDRIVDTYDVDYPLQRIHR